MFLAFISAFSLVPLSTTLSVWTQPISIREDVPLGGYTERLSKPHQPGGEPLFVRVLAFRERERRIALVSAELLTIPASLTRQVRQRLPADVQLFLSATHTHCAPDSQMLNSRMTLSIPGIASFRAKELELHADEIARAIRLALARVGSPLTQLSLSSGEVDANQGRREGAKPSKSLSVVHVGSRTLLHHYAAHPTLLGSSRMQTHGDWPGVLASRTAAMVLVGAMGDVAPAAAGRDEKSKVMRMVDNLLRTRVHRRWEAASPTVEMVTEPVALDVVQPHPEFAARYSVPDSLAMVTVRTFAAQASELALLRIGNLLLIGVPGEPSAQVGRSLEAVASRHGFHPLVVSNVGDWVGYVLKPDDYHRGAYEATLSFHGPDTSQRILESFERGLRRLNAIPNTKTN